MIFPARVAGIEQEESGRVRLRLISVWTLQHVRQALIDWGLRVWD